MFTWAQFYPWVLPSAPGAPNPVVDHCLRSAAIEFAEETGIEIIDIDEIPLVSGTAEYTIATGSDELDMSVVKYAWLNNRRIYPIPQDTLNDVLPTHWPSDTASEPIGFTQPTQDVLRIYPVPVFSGVTHVLKLKLVVRPSLASTGVTDWIGTRFVQELSVGAIALLTDMHDTSWYNPEVSAAKRALFEAAKTKATIDANRSFTRTPLRIQLRSVG